MLDGLTTQYVSKNGKLCVHCTCSLILCAVYFVIVFPKIDKAVFELSTDRHMKESTLLAITIRVLIAVSTRTYFQPDEYFQSLEPAHQLVFGYGHLTWEWMASPPIRSIFYPLFNVPVYWFLKNTGILETGKLGDCLLVGEYA